MKTCLLLGGSGFIGQSLIERLKSEYHIRVFTNEILESNNFDEEIEYVQGDFVLKDDFTDILENVDIVFHMISTTIPTDTTDIVFKDINENIIPTVRLLENLKIRPWIKLIFISSGGTVYGNTKYNPISENTLLKPICSYGMQKAVIEQYISMYGRLYNIDYTIIRLSNPYGTGQNPSKKQGIIPIFIRKILNHEQLTIWGDGETVRDYIFIDDAIDAIVRLLYYDDTNKIFNVGTGEGHSTKEILKIISEITGINNINVIYLPSRSCDVEINILDIQKINKSVGWSPLVSLDSGIRSIIENIKL